MPSSLDTSGKMNSSTSNAAADTRFLGGGIRTVRSPSIPGQDDLYNIYFWYFGLKWHLRTNHRQIWGVAAIEPSRLPTMALTNLLGEYLMMPSTSPTQAIRLLKQHIILLRYFKETTLFYAANTSYRRLIARLA